mmetsp:Transcript_31092/g.42138  ORF Transcript_31092/g.42138 Transcript_31092/m.42138 type:complete len:80 (-) Transcript_31092:225-464(-)
MSCRSSTKISLYESWQHGKFFSLESSSHGYRVGTVEMARDKSRIDTAKSIYVEMIRGNEVIFRQKNGVTLALEEKSAFQ